MASEEARDQAPVRSLEVLLEVGASGALMEAVEQDLVASLVAQAVSQVFEDSSAQTAPEGLSAVLEAALLQVILILVHWEAPAEVV